MLELPALLLALSLLIIIALLLYCASVLHSLKQNSIQTELNAIEAALRTALSDLRTELHDVSAANRRENNENHKNLQDSLLNRITENNSLQQQQLNNFKSHLDSFTEKTLEKWDSFDTRIKHDALSNRQELGNSLNSFENKFNDGIKDFTTQLRQQFSELITQQTESSKQAKTNILEVKQTVEQHLQAIRTDNTQQLNEMRKTVDEKLHDTLEKRLGESFKRVSDQLEQVHKGLGEMQTLAIGVGDLKKVLSNVKTRGILGEYQLGNILEQLLAPDQYATNVSTKPNSRDHVEYAVKLPGKSDEKTVWLPIDSKFPLESYQTLLTAWEEGNPQQIEAAQKLLFKAIDSFAKDISSKYIAPPHTTDFAILFLPIESLYAEVLRNPEMFERLQRQYRITITGPTTLSALLNSLSMGFRTLAVQQRSSEVWKVLAEVKTEFCKYTDQLATVHKHLHSASSSLETLQTTRTNVLTRKLENVEKLTLESKE